MFYKLKVSRRAIPVYIDANNFAEWVSNRGEQVSANFSERIEQLTQYMQALGHSLKIVDFSMEEKVETRGVE